MSETQRNRLLMYYQIHQLKNSKFKISQIARELGISRKTVYFYLSMDEPGFESWLSNGRSRKLSDYEGLIRERLSKYPDLSAYQIHDWLLEHYPGLKVSRRTVSDYVAALREQYDLPKPAKDGRIYEQVAECEYGAQAQVDFGEYRMKQADGQKIKVYFFTMVLSRSRAKYVHFSLHPFTAESSIEAHERSFAYYGGLPAEMVYDQDSVFLVDENGGELVMTRSFQSYVDLRGFAVHFCRKADPESKGKIESVVKYVKTGFLSHRLFTHVDLLNEEVLAWLGRTANGQLHGTTKKIPAEELAIERAYLHPFRAIASVEPAFKPYAVRKDNTLSYKGNYYSLPRGTYRGKGSKVWVRVEAEELIISQKDKSEIARHRIRSHRGRQVRNNDHFRDKSPQLDTLRKSLCTYFTDAEQAEAFFQALYHKRARYFRDQLQMIQASLKKHEGQCADQALSFCMDKQLFAASDFGDLMDHLNHRKEEPTADLEQICLESNATNQLGISPQKSDIQTYEQLFQQSKS